MKNIFSVEKLKTKPRKKKSENQITLKLEQCH